MRLLHTSDWHLGHALHDHPRTHEHARFLGWLLATIASERVDALSHRGLLSLRSHAAGAGAGVRAQACRLVA